MHTLSLELKGASAISHAVVGQFDKSSKTQQILVVQGSTLRAMEVSDSFKLKERCERNVFGTIRSILPFRLTGSTTDHIIIGSDSGRITILELLVDRFNVVHQETFGKSGSRRFVPGQFLAIDPRGRACMIGNIDIHK